MSGDEWIEVLPPACRNCNGEGKIADTEDGEPWSAWADLPPGSDLAVQLGIVKPIRCPECNGTGNKCDNP